MERKIGEICLATYASHPKSPLGTMDVGRYVMV